MRQKVKLARGEKVLPPNIAANPRNRVILEAMNAEGLRAREAGGVAAYKANGGHVGYMNRGGQIGPAYRVDGGVTPLPGAKEPTKRSFGQWAEDNRTGLGKVGQSLIAIGQRDFKGAGAAFGSTPGEIAAEKDANKAGKALEAEKKAIQKIVNLAAGAYNSVPVASDALRFIQSKAHISGGEWAGILAGAAKGISVQDSIDAITGRAAILLTAEVRKGTISVESEAAYINLQADLTDITAIALAAQGGGPKTDFDFEVAERSVANLSSSEAAIQSSMTRLIKKARETAATEGFAIQVPELGDAAKVGEYIPPNDKVGDVKTEITEKVGDVKDNVSEKVEDVKTEITEKVGDVKDAIKNRFKKDVPEPEETVIEEVPVEDGENPLIVSSPEDVATEGSSKSNPILISDKKLSKKKALKELEGLSTDTFITITLKDGFRKETTVTDTVANVRAFLENK